MNRDLRKYAQSTNFRLVLGFVLLLFLIGDGLIYLIYGRGAALMGLVCIFGGLLPVFMILLLFGVLDRIVKKVNEE